MTRSHRQTLGVWLVFFGLVIFGGLRYDNFLGSYNIASFLNYNAMFIAISIGMCFVIMTGGIDLSVGSVAAFASVIAAYLSPYGLEVALPGGILAGMAFGAINAFFITVMRIPPFIATLATMLGAKGGSLVISGAQTISIDWSSNFTLLGLGKAFGVLPWTIVVVLILVLFTWVLLECMPLGRKVLAVGDNEQAATLMGLNVNRVKVFVYLLSGGCAGLAGVFLASGFGAGQPLEGVGWELSAIAGVVVGGTLLTGGSGSITATVGGALLLGLIFNVLNFENGLGSISLSAYWQMVIRGGFLLGVILVQAHLVKKHALNKRSLT
ncbi:ABC transporter permease [Enterovibrio nigricans]|uniref:Monosaccharide ABC transporter membrane protein, CUT2 family (TC 3.A.1.2.-) n=1 Tax=Enterovibrio nigricans DSM 22720 TaxID=1121868 RepID=A0A1T4USH5_9GAMM|nr:ABC transporter permease [Enterovibrio nigricans]PKF49047.1 ABC transporter permease [Enterovibrio nigricans]SKA55677.1 monosaccharide ABC transporter membrane protein, CUT2 family (TC 3.A.1.2.-) [Enterovibrio nigricans DSM 22720]